MALEKVSDILKQAEKDKHGVIAFDTFNYESIAWLIEVANEEKLPIIQMLYPSMKKHIPFDVYADTVKDLAKKVDVPIGLHLDHSNSFEEIMAAIKAGFTSVMIDGSRLPYDENVCVTREVVKAAHAMGVDVEAELGLVGVGKNQDDFVNKDLYTSPEQAKDFIEKTNVDYLAIAIGSAHGDYISTPNLDLERLKEINKTVDNPLVLHGGSGIPISQIKEAFSLGITKLNVGTEYFQTFYSKTKEIALNDDSGQNYVGFIMKDLKEAIKEYLHNKLQIARY